MADESSLVLGNVEVWWIYLLGDLKCYFILLFNVVVGIFQKFFMRQNF